MKINLTSILIWLISFSCFGQDITKKNTLTLNFGPSSIMRQDIIFSPFVHSDFSFMNLGLSYTRESKYYQKISLRYANFNPMVAAPYEFTFHSEPNIAYPHSFNIIDLDYLFGKKISETENGTFTAGGLFSTDIQVMNYVYGRISNLGYAANFGLGIFGTYAKPINEKSRLSTTLKLPMFAWIARSPYLVNDDEFIENISSHSGLKTFRAFIGDGQIATWNKIQTLDLELKYEYSLSSRWEFGAGYLFEFIHLNQPRNLLSFRNSLDLSLNYKF